MTQLLLIKTTSLSSVDNREVGDVVGMFDDKHVFSEHEQAIFDIVKVEATKENLQLFYPEVRPVLRTGTTGWVFEEKAERKEVWRDSKGDWKEVVESPRFKVRYELGTLTNNYTRYEENKTNTLVAAEISKG